MKWRKAVVICGLTIMMTVSTVGCGADNSAKAADSMENLQTSEGVKDSEGTQPNGDAQESEGTTEAEDASEQEKGRNDEHAVMLVKVTTVEGNTITADMGERPAAPEPDGETPPEKPEGEAHDRRGKDPSERPNGIPGEGGFTASGESLTFTLTNDTVIMVESKGNSETGTAEDIVIGSIAMVVLDEENNALEVRINL
ncbi:MAG: hypothetical protein J6B10_01585 [Lachnospiraceae bacterium]|nr:hypothetical protein [Lachnospiraceae bacterium]